MQFTNFLVAGLGLIAGAQAQPVEERVPVAHLTFHGGPASYTLSVPVKWLPSANHFANTIDKDNGISVDSIDSPDYDALHKCTFYTSGPKTLTGSSTHITVGPPQPILGVSC
ncbi:hypothetical protein NPX13_g6094 [Xylaria arbuscula]|uniref:Uncharacterized protein n=1 Tax=Xylaria arbuscula TaxID=114810 RepID=A0A9W8TKP9_9PEZI|nr:hypothetical protein NPX13_g6094 [Xylaria arbuscula]